MKNNHFDQKNFYNTAKFSARTELYNNAQGTYVFDHGAIQSQRRYPETISYVNMILRSKSMDYYVTSVFFGKLLN